MANTPHPVCVQVIRLLKKERERRGLSKYFVAQESGMSPQMIGYVENEMRNPTLETVLRIAEAMNVDLAEIIRKAQAGVVGEQKRNRRNVR